MILILILILMMVKAKTFNHCIDHGTLTRVKWYLKN